MKANPPKRPIQFLRWFCREDCLEEIEGDLTEVFKKQYESSPQSQMEIRLECDPVLQTGVYEVV